MERSFARAKRYGYDRARWRGLWRVRIQEYLIASIQNIQILLKYGTDPRIAVAVRRVREELNGKLKSLFKSSNQYLLGFFQLSIWIRKRLVIENNLTYQKTIFEQQPVET